MAAESSGRPAPADRANRGAAPVGRVVVAPLDGMADGERALGHAAVLARRLGGHLDVIHVLAPAGPRAGPVPAPDDPAHAYLADAAERLCRDTGLPTRAVRPRLLVGDVGTEVVRHAEMVAAAAVVLPIHARSAAAQAVKGSVALDVMRTAHCPVVLVPSALAPAPDDGWPRAILVASDGDLPADEAFAPLAALTGPEAGSPLRTAARPAHAVLDAARARGADLIAVVTRGITHRHRGVGRPLAGSVAEAVVRGAACPVWVGHRSEAGSAAPVT